MTGTAEVDALKSELSNDDFLSLPKSFMRSFLFIFCCFFVSAGPHFIFFNCTCPVCTPRMRLWASGGKAVGSVVAGWLRGVLSCPPSCACGRLCTWAPAPIPPVLHGLASRSLRLRYLRGGEGEAVCGRQVMAAHASPPVALTYCCGSGNFFLIMAYMT